MTVAAQVTPTQPTSLTLFGPGHTIFQELCVHVRNGFVVHPDFPVHFFENGNVQVMCVLGNPTQAAIDMARASNELAVAEQEAEFKRAVEAEAKRLIEQQQREALAKQLAVIKAEQARQIAAAEKAAAAAIAKLTTQ